MLDPRSDTSCAEALLALAGDYPDRTLGGRIVAAPTTASTNDDALRWLHAHGPTESHGVVFIAASQTQGRGTRGRRWHSATDATLPLSIVLAPDPPLARPAALTLVAGLAVVQAGRATGARVSIKWPNDVVDDAGRKIAGVLAESRSTSPPAHVVGIGVNVRPTPNIPDLDVTPGSLREAGSDLESPAAFVLPLLSALSEAFDELRRHGSAETAHRFNRCSWLTGRRVRLRRGREEFAGTFSHLDDELRVVLVRAGTTVSLGPAEQLEFMRGTGSEEPNQMPPVSGA